MLSVEATDTMPCAHTAFWVVVEVAVFGTVREPSRGAVVSCCQYPTISHDDRTNLPTWASRPRLHEMRDLDKVRIPTWPFRHAQIMARDPFGMF